MTSFRIDAVEFSLGEHETELLVEYPEFAPVLEKTGMPRHFGTDASLLELAARSAHKALDAHPKSRDIGALIVVTQSSEHFLPSVACVLQDRLGISRNVLAFDINQGCSGFVQALVVAVGLLDAHRSAMIVCADKYRSKLRTDDRSTLAVFSDASAAVLISRDGPLRIGIQSHLTDGSGGAHLIQPVGKTLHMGGSDVFIWTRTKVARQIGDLIERETREHAMPDVLYMHQASRLVVDSVCGTLPQDIRTPVNYEKVGNTTSSSIPILIHDRLDEFTASNSLLAGFGVGLSSSCVTIRRT